MLQFWVAIVSPDTRPRSSRRRAILIVGVLVVALVAAAWILPLRYVGDVRAGPAELASIPTSDGSRETRIVVPFSTPRDLAALRRSSGLGFVTARLSDCDGTAGDTEEVIDQGAGYLSDKGRVRGLGTRNGRHYYQVAFDNTLDRPVDNQFDTMPATNAAGGLCFSLRGSAMWFGYLWSNSVPLTRRS